MDHNLDIRVSLFEASRLVCISCKSFMHRELLYDRLILSGELVKGAWNRKFKYFDKLLFSIKLFSIVESF